MATTQVEMALFAVNWVISVNFPFNKRRLMPTNKTPLMTPVVCRDSERAPTFTSKLRPRMKRQKWLPFPRRLKNVEIRIKGDPSPGA
jgi:hypothetical protein